MTSVVHLLGNTFLFTIGPVSHQLFWLTDYIRKNTPKKMMITPTSMNLVGEETVTT
jgi:hypothetical protein